MQLRKSVTDRYVFRTLTLLAAGMFAASWGCKPKEPAPPEKPELAPLAKPPSTSPRTSAVGLPPGHPPIEGAPPQPTPGNDGLPSGHPPIDGLADAEQAGEPGDVEAPTMFDGIELTPPDGWLALPRKSTGGAFAVVPEAAFELPAGDAADEDVSVRLTHFPGMRNVPLEMNLNRWYAQFLQPDGRNTKDAAVTQSFVIDGITVTLADISGTFVQGNIPNYRMLAAAIEHEQGPHFLTVKGPAPAVAKWRDSVVDYVKSVKRIP